MDPSGYYAQKEFSESETSDNLTIDGDNNTTPTNIKTDETEQMLQKLKNLIDTTRVAETVDPEGVDELHRQIDVNEKNRQQLEQQIEQKKQETLERIDSITGRSLEKIRELEGLKQERINSFTSKLLKILHLPDKKLEELEIKLKYENFTTESLSKREKTLSDEEINVLNKEILQILKPEDLLESYYRKFEYIELSNDEKRELLKPEVLEQLSMDEYIRLWKKLNPEFLSHVVRQGFRDHHAMVYHSAGIYDFHNGFMDIIEDNFLIKAPMVVAGVRGRNEENIQRYLQGMNYFKREEETDLRNLKGFSYDSYHDSTAVHFMSEEVGADYYGAEENNDVFFIFPTDTIVSQYNFAFNGAQSLTRTPAEKKWNDVYVWPGDSVSSGININAGIVFLPDFTLVDPETGSKYASEIVYDGQGNERRVILKDQELIRTFGDFYKNLKENPDNGIYTEYVRVQETTNYEEREERRNKLLEKLKKELSVIGIPEPFVNNTAYLIMNTLSIDSYTLDDALKNFEKVAKPYILAKEPITAREFWEKKFSERPEMRPKHIVYYDGDATQAVEKFLRINGIGLEKTPIHDKRNKSGNTFLLNADNAEKDDLLGFGDHYIKDKMSNPLSNIGKEEFIEIAQNLIKRHYQQKTVI